MIIQKIYVVAGCGKMSFLNDCDIYDNLDVFFPGIDQSTPGRPKLLQPSSFELTLGNEVFISGGKELVKLGGHDERYVSIKPGDFAVLLTFEEVNIPDHLMAFISIKASLKNSGLVNISGFHVDPGFCGKLTFSVYNAGPSDIILRHKQAVFIIFFAELTAPAFKPYHGKHNGQNGISSEDMNRLTGKSVSPLDLDMRLTKLEHRTQLQWGLFAALATGVLIMVIKTFIG